MESRGGEEKDDFDSFSYSFYADNGNSFTDSKIVNNYELTDSLTDSLNDSLTKEDLIIAETPPDPINYLSNRTREKWVEDSAVTKCRSCKTTFRIYRRRHHCKIDGHIYCDSCTTYRAKIPRVIKKIPTRSGKEEPINYNTPVRLCKNCFETCETINKLEKLLTVFSLLDLDLFDFKNLSMVCKAWRPMALFYLSKFREIQYKLPKYSYNSWEKQALWNNRLILKNHSIWQVHVLRSLKNSDNRIDSEKFQEAVRIYYINGSKHEKDSKECWSRMCNRYCKPKLDPDRALLLLDLLYDDEICWIEIDILAKNVVQAFDKCDDYTLELYLPYILFKTVSCKNLVLKDFIFRRSKASIRIANACYWFFKNNSRKDFAELFQRLPKDMLSKILKSENFTELCKDKEDTRENNDFKDTVIVSPVKPELGDQQVFDDKIVVKKSATKPLFIPCNKSTVLFKKDDIRKDYIIMCVIRLMEKILQEHGLDLSIVTYNVQPTSSNEGFIEIVENAETLYSISEKLQTTLINFLMKHNPDESVSNLRTRFKNSCAVYSVIAFLLSISDRNTENLMLTKNGSLFHIDFGYILSLDPKTLRTPCIRITDQMLDALGGPKSKEYEEFKELCATIYDILRKHVNTFVCLLSLIPTFKSTSKTSPNLSEDEMFTEIIKRFCPGESYEEAMKNIKTRIDNSTNSSTFSKYHVIDFFHKMNKEATVSNFLSGTISSAYSGTRSLMGGMYSYMFSFT